MMICMTVLTKMTSPTSTPVWFITKLLAVNNTPEIEASTIPKTIDSINLEMFFFGGVALKKQGIFLLIYGLTFIAEKGYPKKWFLFLSLWSGVLIKKNKYYHKYSFSNCFQKYFHTREPGQAPHLRLPLWLSCMKWLPWFLKKKDF